MIHLTRGRRFAVLLAFVVTAGWSMPAGAFMATSTTKSYFAPADMPPGPADDYLRGHPGDGIEMTILDAPAGQNGVDGIFYALGPVSHKQTVCRFSKTQIFPHPSGGKILWDGKPASPNDYSQFPFDMGLVTAMACPRQDDQTYIALEKTVLDAEFAEIVAFWKDVATSQEKFDAVSYFLPNIIPPRLGDQFAAFRTGMLSAPGQFRLLGVYRRGRDGFDLSIGADPSDVAVYGLSVSKSGAGGLMMVNFSAEQR
jgi:hypothetical protein